MKVGYIYDMKINHLRNPLGYQMDSVVFSWKVTGVCGKHQEWARISVATDKTFTERVFDSGEDTQADSLAYPVSLTLIPRCRYYWTVTVKTDAGEEVTGEMQWFETGRLDEAWTAKWISCGMTEKRHPVFYKEIALKGTVKRARLYISGLGLYEAYIGGEKIGDEYFAPYFNDYNEWVQYQTYDVTRQLNETGEKAVLSVLLGNGWYIWRPDEEMDWAADANNRWALLAELLIAYEDGSTQVIATDESWKVRRSQITLSNIFNGQHEDATLAKLPPEQAVVCEAPRGKLTARYSIPVTAHETFEPVEVIQTPERETVIDLGQEITGTFRLHIHEVPKGAVIRIQTGEVLQQGNFYRDNLRTAKSEYVYVSDGTEQMVSPQFTFYGYRYAKIEGFENFRKEDFTGIALYSNVEQTGTLTTGHPLVNQLISNVRWGMKDNFVDVPTDCPQRDERQGWTGDAQVFSGTAMYLADTYAFYRKYLHDMEMQQKARGGAVPDIVPTRTDPGKVSCEAAWSDAVTIIPWNLYQMYGDVSILREQYASMKAWVDYLVELDGDDFGWRRHFQFGDWLALDGLSVAKEDSFGGTDEGYIASIYFANSAEIVSKTAAILGNTEEMVQYAQIAKRQWDGVRDEYFSKNGRCCADTQTGLLLALKYHLSSNEKAVRERLNMFFEKSKNALRTGFVGTPILCKVLSENGMGDVAYKLLLREEYPGWLHEVKLGATTVWERWNSLDEEGNISGTGMNSLNHYAYGSVVEWLFGYAAGLKLGDMQKYTAGTRFMAAIHSAEDTADAAQDLVKCVGGRYLRIEPELNWNLHKLDAEFNSAAGRYRCNWEITDSQHVTLHIEIPFDCEADVILPLAAEETYRNNTNPLLKDVEKGVCRLKAGIYDISYETRRPLMKKLGIHSLMRDIMDHPQAVAMLRNYMTIDAVNSSFYDRELIEIIKIAQMFSPADVHVEDVEELDKILHSL